MQVRIGNAVLKLIQGDITDEKVDAITNAANDRLWMGSGVAGAIKSKGGEEIEMEAMRQGPIEIGDVVVTEPGALQAKHVIHAAVMGQDLVTSSEAIQKATENTLKKADDMKLETVSLPAFGTGVGHFHAADAADAILDKAIDSLIEAKNLKEVHIVLIDKGIYDIFAAKLKKKFSR
ncbi:MAG: macro domain-containing protein [Candidatus Zixiibacteriota bacterium]